MSCAKLSEVNVRSWCQKSTGVDCKAPGARTEVEIYHIGILEASFHHTSVLCSLRLISKPVLRRELSSLATGSGLKLA